MAQTETREEPQGIPGLPKGVLWEPLGSSNMILGIAMGPLWPPMGPMGAQEGAHRVPKRIQIDLLRLSEAV